MQDLINSKVKKKYLKNLPLIEQRLVLYSNIILQNPLSVTIYDQTDICLSYVENVLCAETVHTLSQQGRV